MKPEIVEIQLWRYKTIVQYKTIVVIKRQQQTTISNKQVLPTALPRQHLS